MSETAVKRKEWGFLSAPKNSWDRACKLKLSRKESPTRKFSKYVRSTYSIMDPGVNFFILMLEQMGQKTCFSCEGHPDGFYIVFISSDKLARKISEITPWCKVELNEGYRRYILRMSPLSWIYNRVISIEQLPSNPYNIKEALLRGAANYWEEEFGKLVLG